MKQISFLLSAFLILFAVSSCKDKKATDTGSDTGEQTVTTEAAEYTEAPAVCVYWAGLSLRAEPSGDAKYLTSVKLGEKVTSLGETAIDTASNDIEYRRIRLMDGTEGWSQSSFIVVDAEPAVLIKDADVYSRPDLVTKTSKFYSKMDVVAVMQSQGEWIEVKGKRKEGKWTETGWIKPINISYEPTDIAVAIFTRQAMDEDKDEEKIAALEEIIQNSDLSQSELIPVVINLLEELQETPEPEMTEEL